MKTAALAQRSSSGPEAAKGSNAGRKPFFSAPVRARGEAERTARANHHASITPLTPRGNADATQTFARDSDKVFALGKFASGARDNEKLPAAARSPAVEPDTANSEPAPIPEAPEAVGAPEAGETDSGSEASVGLETAALGPEAPFLAPVALPEPPAPTAAPAPLTGTPSEIGHAFNVLPPSAQADAYQGLGAALDSSFAEEAAGAQNAVPELNASLEGEAAPAEPPIITTPAPTPSPAGQALAGAAEPTVYIPKAPEQAPVSQPALPAAQAAEAGALDETLGAIDPAPPIQTALETPEVPLEGKADPAALETLESAASGEAETALGQAQAGVTAVSPEAVVQPLALNATVAAPQLPEVPVPSQSPRVEGLDRLAGYGLGARDRAAFDAQVGPAMEAAVAGAEAELVRQEQDFDQEQTGLHLEAEAESAAAQSEAQASQRLEVERSRQVLASEQQATHDRQQAAVDGALGEFAANKDAKTQEIEGRVATDRAALDHVYADAEAEAVAKVEEGTAQAEDAEKSTAKDAEAESWWDWAIDSWQALVQGFADWLVAIWEGVAEAVAGIFERTQRIAATLVSAAVAFVKQRLSDYFARWTWLIDNLLGSIFPEIAAAFRAFMERLKSALFAALDWAAAKYLALLRFIADKLVAALYLGLELYKAGVAAYLAAWEAIQNGQWRDIGRAVLSALLTAVGIEPAAFFTTFTKIGEVIDQVIADPTLIGKRAIDALSLGFWQFGANFIGNFTIAFIEWITGSISIQMPKSFGLAGIFDVVSQILNLTYDYLRAKAVKHLGEGAVTAVEELTAMVWALVSEGWSGLWNLVKNKLTSLVDDVVIVMGTWLVEKAILVAGRWIAGLVATMGWSALVEGLIALWQFVMWIKDQFQRFWMIVESTVESVHEFVSGNIQPAANKIEGTLQDLIIPAIDLVAKLLNLGNIAKKVEQIIQSVRQKIDEAIDALINNLLAKIKAGAKKVKEAVKKLLSWWTAKSEFRDTSNTPHTLSYLGERKSAKLYVASTNPNNIEPFLNEREKNAPPGEGPGYNLKHVQEAKRQYMDKVKRLEDELTENDTLYDQRDSDRGSKTTIQEEKQNKLVNANNTIVTALQCELDILGKKYIQYFFNPSVPTDFPPPKLPVMADNIKGKNRTLEADYIVDNPKKYNYRVQKGTETSDYVGHLYGMKELSDAGLRGDYTMMHLIPSSLGGDAVDSNLTPVIHTINNPAFHHGVELPAAKASTIGSAETHQPIWYTFKIEYYSPSTRSGLPTDAFPKFLSAEWGYYMDRTGLDHIKRGSRAPENGIYSETPRLPNATGEPQVEEETANEAAAKARTYARFLSVTASRLSYLGPLSIRHNFFVAIDAKRRTFEIEKLAENAELAATQTWQNPENASHHSEAAMRFATEAEALIVQFVSHVRQQIFSDNGAPSPVAQKFLDQLSAQMHQLGTRSINLKMMVDDMPSDSGSKHAGEVRQSLFRLNNEGTVRDSGDSAKISDTVKELQAKLRNNEIDPAISEIKALAVDQFPNTAALQVSLNAVVTAVQSLADNSQDLSPLVQQVNDLFEQLPTPLNNRDIQIARLKKVIDIYRKAIYFYEKYLE